MVVAESAGSTRPGLRERKKAYTRESIALAAWTLFQQQGVADTSLREIGELAEVSDKTINNYFPTKAALVAATLDLFASPDSVVELAAQRPMAEHPITAFRRAVAEGGKTLDDAVCRSMRKVMQVVRSDPDLRAAWHHHTDAATDLLAASMAERARAHGMDELSLATACSACFTVMNVIAHHQPARPKAVSWLGQIDDALARLERGWLAERPD